MSIYEAIGIAWVIFSSAITTFAILYLSLIGLKAVLRKRLDGANVEVPVEVTEMFKIGR